MKIFLLFCCLALAYGKEEKLVNIQARKISASAQKGWVQLSQTLHEASDPAGIRALLEQYPDNFNGLDAGDLAYASARVTQYHWVGPSVCNPGDPRLQFEKVNVKTRTGPASKRGGRAKIASASPRDILPAPCTEDFPPDGHWVLDAERLTEYRSERELAIYLERNSGLKNTKASDLEYASENFKDFHWEGKTSCAPGDPRLRLSEDHGEVRYLGPNGESVKKSTTSSSTQDPCAS